VKKGSIQRETTRASERHQKKGIPWALFRLRQIRWDGDGKKKPQGRGGACRMASIIQKGIKKGGKVWGVTFEKTCCLDLESGEDQSARPYGTEKALALRNTPSCRGGTKYVQDLILTYA